MNMAVPAPAGADILIVDDNAINVELLECLLEEEGYEQLESFTDPLLAERRIHRQCPDLILLDIRMPGLTGFELMERLKQRLGAAMPAVIFLTAQIDEQTRYRALELGAQDFITKPFDHTEVLQRLNNALQLRLLLRERSERADLMEQLVAQRTAELKQQSRQDPVTRLPNRHGLLEVLVESLQSDAGPVGVLFLALEGGSDVARLHGYTIADQLSLELARRLQACAQPQGVVAGVWNSSEWLMICPGWQSDPDRHDWLEQLQGLIREPFRIEQLALRLDARIGLSVGDKGAEPEQLVRMAALALPDSPGHWQRYDAALEQQLRERQLMQDELARAQEAGEFQLAYQPKVDLATGALCGAEALLRWNSARFGNVSPARFIPMAEAGGEILAIGDWVQRQAIARLGDWYARGLVSQRFTMAFNVASAQLMQSDFADRVVEQVRAAGVPPRMVEIEVTESGLMEDVERAKGQLLALAEAGIGIAIDDFGTGYSSLAYLKTLPVSVLKIDRVFIRDLHISEQDQRLAETVIGMARHFRCKTVAEGVEQPEQLEMLLRMGCDQVQGFLFAPPLNEKAFLQMVDIGFGHLFAR